jgi:hypothetical protein
LGLDLDVEMEELPEEAVASMEQMDAYRRPEKLPADPAAAKLALRQLLGRFDANGDGQLTPREAPPRLRQNFERADADANGRLDRQELQAVAERMARIQPPAENRKKLRPPATQEIDGSERPRRRQEQSGEGVRPRKSGAI